MTNRSLLSNRQSVEFYSGDIEHFVNIYLKSKYKNIWMVGGATVAKEFIRLKLVDELIISIIPIILGGGVLFFDTIGEEFKLNLKDMTAYIDGTVELTYRMKS